MSDINFKRCNEPANLLRSIFFNLKGNQNLQIAMLQEIVEINFKYNNVLGTKLTLAANTGEMQQRLK